MILDITSFIFIISFSFFSFSFLLYLFPLAGMFVLAARVCVLGGDSGSRCRWGSACRTRRVAPGRRTGSECLHGGSSAPTRRSPPRWRIYPRPSLAAMAGRSGYPKFLGRVFRVLKTEIQNLLNKIKTQQFGYPTIRIRVRVYPRSPNYQPCTTEHTWGYAYTEKPLPWLPPMAWLQRHRARDESDAGRRPSGACRLAPAGGQWRVVGGGTLPGSWTPRFWFVRKLYACLKQYWWIHILKCFL